MGLGKYKQREGISVCMVHFNASEESQTNPGLSCMDASALLALKGCANGVQACHGYAAETPKKEASSSLTALISPQYTCVEELLVFVR